MLSFFLILLVVALAGDWLAIRDWRGGPFLGDDGENTATVILGGAAKGPSMAMLPVAAFALTALALSAVLAELRDRLHGSAAHVVGVAQAVVDPAFLVLLALCASVFLFMRPRFLVPPPLRGKPGFVVARI